MHVKSSIIDPALHSIAAGTDDCEQVEADELCWKIEERANELRNAGYGNKANILSSRFKLIRFNRNVVYRIANKTRRWYLKLSKSGSSAMAQRELLGARAVSQTAASHRAYRSPTFIRVSTKFDYVLSTEVFGTYLNSAVYRASISPYYHELQDITRAYGYLGQILAHLHKDVITIDLPPAIATAAPDKLRMAIASVGSHSSIYASIREFLDDIPTCNSTTFIHGNLRRENILLNNGVCLLDFETCGAGSRYDDLSLISSNLALTRAAMVFPWKRVFRTWSVFLNSYRRVFPYDKQTLVKYILMQLSTQYAWLLAKKKVTVATIPVSKSRLEFLIWSLLDGNCEIAFPGVEF